MTEDRTATPGPAAPGPGALARVRLVEVTEHIAGAFCGKLLADLGAEIIHLEDPEVPDRLRTLGPFPGDQPDLEQSGLFSYLNANKLSVTLNLRKNAGRRVLGELLKEADCLVIDRALPPSKAGALRPQSLQRKHPHLVVVSISAFGLTGPWRDYRARELNVYHASGMAYLTRQDRSRPDTSPPLQQGFSFAEYFAGYNAAVAALTALHPARTSGEGQLVDLSKQECSLSLLQPTVGHFTLEGRIIGKEPEGRYAGGSLETKDGHQVVIDAPQAHQWVAIVEAMGNPDWAEGDWWKELRARSENADFLSSKLREWARSLTRDELMFIALERHIPLAVVHSPSDLFADHHLQARECFLDTEIPGIGVLPLPSAPYRLSETPSRIGRAAPRRGQHTAEILRDRLGYTTDDLLALARAGVT